MKGVKQIILRKRGGPSAKRIRKDPKFKTVRLNGREFAARSKATAVFVRMLQSHKALADYNYCGAVASHMKVVQDLDTENDLGCRSILFSKHPDLWEGLSLNKKHAFDTQVSAPLVCTISRETLSARIAIPELVPDVNLLLPPGARSLFRIQAAFGLLPDFVYQDSRKRYVPSALKERIAPELTATAWMPCLSLSPATVLELKLPEIQVQGGFALMVSVGICFGVPLDLNGRVTQLKTGGAAKVLAVV
jgi:hypothetical protein